MTALPLTVAQRRLAAAVLLCIVAAVVLLRGHGGGTPAAGGGALRVAPLRPTTTAVASSGAGQLLVVDVVGAVHRPGLYRLPRGARVADAVRRAGGLTRKAERAAVNLAAPLADGEQVLIAARGSAGAVSGAAAGNTGAAGPAAPVSLSTATAEQLDALPGVGPVTAQKIIAYREQHGPFTSVDALDAIPGIGPARIADLRGLVVP